MSQAFSGTQNVSSIQKDEAWRVNVRIQGCDLEHGYLCGTMEALNVPMADTPVSTSSIWFFHLTTTRNINNSFVCVCVCVCVCVLCYMEDSAKNVTYECKNTMANEL